MKNFFKLFGILALAAVIGFSLAGCGGDGGNGITGGGGGEEEDSIWPDELNNTQWEYDYITLYFEENIIRERQHVGGGYAWDRFEVVSWDTLTATSGSFTVKVTETTINWYRVDDVLECSYTVTGTGDSRELTLTRTGRGNLALTCTFVSQGS
jgi:hypothetical protein